MSKELGNEPGLPVFTKRKGKERVQVRFWSTPEEYDAFKQATLTEGLMLQDVFGELMAWFVKMSLEKRVALRTANVSELAKAEKE